MLTAVDGVAIATYADMVRVIREARPGQAEVAYVRDGRPATVRAETLDIRINGLLLCQGGTVAADRCKADLTGREIIVEIDLHLGEGQATVHTTDLSHGYVEENSAYSS